MECIFATSAIKMYIAVGGFVSIDRFVVVLSLNSNDTNSILIVLGAANVPTKVVDELSSCRNICDKKRQPDKVIHSHCWLVLCTDTC